ncbi:MAG: SGNH/GDSL hydrolase family protein [Planctomycetes bacterium]|nr:SGNH/GDSL hydrolase family protein [Planctomycetota bacterium]
MLRKVVLIGDSIRMGYQDMVRRELENVADVRGPEANCGDSSRILQHVDEWIIAPSPDVVHINCGLHDLRRDYDSELQRVPVELYASNLEALFQAVMSASRAQVVWAATTPVNEQWHRDKKDFERLESQVSAYNAAAAEVAGRFGIPVNDLFDVVTRVGRDTFLSPDGVHFTGPGYELLGEAVAGFIRPLL